MEATKGAVCSLQVQWFQAAKSFQDNLLTTLKMKLSLHVGYDTNSFTAPSKEWMPMGIACTNFL
jgi:hypothetical protein